MTKKPDILCIGSVLWDVIGHSAGEMAAGSDVPGRISRHPGGVALNVAMALCGLGLRPALLSALGDDAEGAELAARLREMGLIGDDIHVAKSRPTDRYMAIESPDGLIAAIADAHTLEAAGAAILDPLRDGRLASPDNPWTGMVALDGNLTADLLAEIAGGAHLAAADLRIAPASPGKAVRLRPFLSHPGVTLYVNLIEANLLSGAAHVATADAARALVAGGAGRALVTDGANAASIACPDQVETRLPAKVRVARVTGAGDALMAAHIAAEFRGETGAAALQTALDFTARHIASVA